MKHLFNQPFNQGVIHADMRRSCSLREGDAWWVNKEAYVEHHCHKRLHAHHFSWEVFFLTTFLCLLRSRCWDRGPGAGAAASVLEKGLRWEAVPLLLAAVQQARGPCCSSSLNYGAMLVLRGPAHTSRSRNGSWTAAREPPVWTQEVTDPLWCKV